MHSNPRGFQAGCQIWWGAASGAARAQRHLLSDAEQARATTLRQAADQDRFVAGRALLRSAAAEVLGTTASQVAVGSSCPDRSRPHGKPTLPGTGWEASISHSGHLVAVALSSAGPVGIDVERVDETLPLDDLEMLSPAEHKGIAHWSALSLFRTWTRKEAVLKATGDGLRVPMPSLSLTSPDMPPAVTSFTYHPDLVDRISMTHHVECVAILEPVNKGA
ncbi:4'-phosphopantetheinyl transferase family protein [Streptomyces virginiae]|uniref:4'-phosphopantetheinyl transferase family protein n=1 Tax=Streptomyces virginiae TaxID=1961 RepID=UPI0032566ACD